MKTILIIFALALISTSCKKTYTCVCSNIDGKTTALTHTGKKKDAQAKCNRYYEETYGNVIGDETTCEIKE